MKNKYLKDLVHRIYELEQDVENIECKDHNDLIIRQDIRERVRILRRCLRREVGWIRYIQFRIAPFAFYEYLVNNHE